MFPHVRCQYASTRLIPFLETTKTQASQASSPGCGHRVAQGVDTANTSNLKRQPKLVSDRVKGTTDVDPKEVRMSGASNAGPDSSLRVCDTFAGRTINLSAGAPDSGSTATERMTDLAAPTALGFALTSSNKCIVGLHMLWIK